MAQGESPRNPLASASVLCPGMCLAVELANSCAYWELPNGNAQRNTLVSPREVAVQRLFKNRFREAGSSAEDFFSENIALYDHTGVSEH